MNCFLILQNISKTTFQRAPIIIEDVSEDAFFVKRKTADEASSFAVSSEPQKSKWKSEKYSRRERLFRQHQVFDTTQSKITDFYEIIQKVTKAIESSEELKQTFCNSELVASCNKNVNYVMKLLYETATKNMNKKENMNRFSNPLKLFSLYIFLLRGPMTYKFLQKNFKNVFPSITTLNRSLNDETSKSRIIEGEVRMNKLKTFLKKKKFPHESLYK